MRERGAEQADAVVSAAHGAVPLAADRSPKVRIHCVVRPGRAQAFLPDRLGLGFPNVFDARHRFAKSSADFQEKLSDFPRSPLELRNLGWLIFRGILVRAFRERP